MMARSKASHDRFFLRLAKDFALAEALKISKDEPHHVFYLVAVPCPDCKRNIGAFAIFHEMDVPNGKRLKRVVATINDGEIITKNIIRH